MTPAGQKCLDSYVTVVYCPVLSLLLSVDPKWAVLGHHKKNTGFGPWRLPCCCPSISVMTEGRPSRSVLKFSPLAQGSLGIVSEQDVQPYSLLLACISSSVLLYMFSKGSFIIRNKCPHSRGERICWELAGLMLFPIWETFCRHKKIILYALLFWGGGWWWRLNVGLCAC